MSELKPNTLVPDPIQSIINLQDRSAANADHIKILSVQTLALINLLISKKLFTEDEFETMCEQADKELSGA